MSNTDRYIDLHLHLDGAVTPEIAVKLADLQGIRLPEGEHLEKMLRVPADCESLNDFLKCFSLPLSLMQTPQGMCEAVRLVGDSMAEQNTIYAEIRFAPQLHTEKGMTQEDAVKAALRGLKKTRLKANLILCMMRGEDNGSKNLETLEIAGRYLKKDGGVTAVDLAGAEALYPTSCYRELFAKAAGYGIPFTVHAGEAAGPESVRSALEYGAARIGHGVRVYEDEDVMKLVKDKGVTLEMCPTSNRITKAVPDMKDYPLRRFLEYGIKVTLNTDDPGIEGTTIADEFRYTEKAFGLTEEQKKTLLRNSVDAAFTAPSVKRKLVRSLGL